MDAAGHRSKVHDGRGGRAIGVIVAEIASRGRCELYIGAIAAKAGVCATIVKRALRQASGLSRACRKLLALTVRLRRSLAVHEQNRLLVFCFGFQSLTKRKKQGSLAILQPASELATSPAIVTCLHRSRRAIRIASDAPKGYLLGVPARVVAKLWT